MIIGYSTVSVDIKRIENIYDRYPKLLEKVFTQFECDEIRKEMNFSTIAGRYAIKVAGARSLNTTIFSLGFHHLQCMRNKSGAVTLSIVDKNELEMSAFSEISLICSISHSKSCAQAVVIAQRNKKIF